MALTTKLDTRYSDDAAEAISWPDAQDRLAGAEVAWLVTVRPDGRPHTTPVVPVWHEGRAYFHTGEAEQKYLNLRSNPHVLVLAGDTRWQGSLDIALEGTARRITDHTLLQAVADQYDKRWDGRWHLIVRDGAFANSAEDQFRSLVFEVVPAKAFAHAKGDPFGQTNYRF